jgi:hypothetical protein
LPVFDHWPWRVERPHRQGADKRSKLQRATQPINPTDNKADRWNRFLLPLCPTATREMTSLRTDLARRIRARSTYVFGWSVKVATVNERQIRLITRNPKNKNDHKMLKKNWWQPLCIQYCTINGLENLSVKNLS